ncbi:Tripartite tricarboxylate transporter TctA family protein [Marinomonas gallaica]|uniref:Tripartite tricarboxylate transporter TctA family protein n=1 Tax=Marinomonas gallaica TaxID=1806667 RepID=A0A1C3JVZ0_9GAMM|nr:tripartite tricarboxylate transporter permease [Marinomonas gallaica]SBT19282.1 Tripartite tricarboxylate transporter TctA family protein [Marinomonas gallaica]SBT20972.1 Tripartite tricarboxylate transporter TctA family protein [Marinomonas gallaica]
MIDNLLIGFGAFSDPLVFIGLLAGAFLGYLIGAIPGLGPTLGVSLLIPFTYSVDPLVAVVTLVSLYAAAEYGGAISAILINSPGTAAAVATSWDGYPLTQQGKAGVALNVSIISSGIGIFISTILLFLTAVPLSEFALNFGPEAYFSLAVMGLSLVSIFSTGSLIKGGIAMMVGLGLATIGLDAQSGVPRFAFDPEFFEGLPLVPALLGLFALSEVLCMIEQSNTPKHESSKMSGIFVVPLKVYYNLKLTLLRSSFMGYVIGIIPGAGASIASFLSYGIAKRVSKTPEKFGDGSLEGISSSESANNAAVSGALAPLLALGIPGSPTTAIIIGALMIHGIQPGPLLFTMNPEVPFTIFASLWISVPVMVLIGLLGAKYWAKVADVPRSILASIVACICLMGAYSSENSMFPVYITIAFGILGYVFRKADIPLAPIVLALVLGEMLETNFRRAVVISGGDYWVFFQKPLSLLLLSIAIISFLVPFIKWVKAKL